MVEFNLDMVLVSIHNLLDLHLGLMVEHQVSWLLHTLAWALVIRYLTISIGY